MTKLSIRLTTTTFFSSTCKILISIQSSNIITFSSSLKFLLTSPYINTTIFSSTFNKCLFYRPIFLNNTLTTKLFLTMKFTSTITKFTLTTQTTRKWLLTSLISIFSITRSFIPLKSTTTRILMIRSFPFTTFRKRPSITCKSLKSQ